MEEIEMSVSDILKGWSGVLFAHDVLLYGAK